MRILAQKDQEIFYGLDGYTDDYYDDSLAAFISKWEKSGFGEFRKDFPLTAELYAELVRIDDGTMRPKAVYAAIISHAKDALIEVEKYKEKLV